WLQRTPSSSWSPPRRGARQQQDWRHGGGVRTGAHRSMCHRGCEALRCNRHHLPLNASASPAPTLGQDSTMASILRGTVETTRGEGARPRDSAAGGRRGRACPRSGVPEENTLEVRKKIPITACSSVHSFTTYER